MIICFWHQCLPSTCGGPHCPDCGSPDPRPHLEFSRLTSQHAGTEDDL